MAYLVTISTREDYERFVLAQEHSGCWFADATKAQSALFNLTMADIRPYQGSPRWDRAAAKARADFDASTAGARAVAAMVHRDIMEIGEVREETSYAFDALMTATEPVLREVAYADYRRACMLEA